MRTVTYDAGFFWDDPNLRWGDPSYQLEPGDPGYVPWSPPYAKHKQKPMSKHQPYLPGDDAGIEALLLTFTTQLSDTLATKYAVTPEQRWRLKQGHLAFKHLRERSQILGEHTPALTALREGMFEDGEGATAIPPLPTLPAVPTIEPVGGGSPVPVQVEADFFDFLGRLVGQIKQTEFYDTADGQALGIVGAEVLPPPDDTKPTPKLRIGPNGKPIVTCKKSPFQGYTTQVQIGDGPWQDAGFSTAREYEIPLALPPAGQVAMWKVRVQYRLKNAPFGQLSDVIEIDVRGR